MRIRKNMLPILAMCLTFLSCDLLGGAGATDHKMYVYSTMAQKLYLLDYKDFELVKEIPLDVPEGVSLYGMALSTNRDYLFFSTYGPQNESPLGFAIYNINKERFEETYFTELPLTGPVSFIAAQDTSQPGLILAHLRDSGTYTINPLERQVAAKVSEEHDFNLNKRFMHSPDTKWTVAQKDWSGTRSFTELEFYAGGSHLQDLQFTLNEGNTDSISIYDMAFSAGNETLFITYQLSGGRSREIESYFGSYDLQTGQLHRSDLSFPWSLNPYYMEYNSKRSEIYTIGAYQELHIIDSKTYTRKQMITLSKKKHAGPSRILISPENDYVFISSPADNLLHVSELDSHKIIQTIKLNEPYEMIIP